MLEIADTICKTKSFLVATLNEPHIDRSDGGHIIVICISRDCVDISDLSVGIIYEFVKLARAVGLAMKKTLNGQGIDVELINYQINGNWSASSGQRDPIHLHLYGRARSAARQKFGEALYLPKPDTGFYADNRGLSQSDILMIQKELAQTWKEDTEIHIVDNKTH